IATLDASTADVEIVYKWRPSTNGAIARGPVRASGAAGAENAYVGGPRNTSAISVSRYTGGTFTSVLGTEHLATTAQAGVWYITRFQALGTQLRVKTWPAASSEPAL